MEVPGVEKGGHILKQNGKMSDVGEGGARETSAVADNEEPVTLGSIKFRNVVQMCLVFHSIAVSSSGYEDMNQYHVDLLFNLLKKGDPEWQAKIGPSGVRTFQVRDHLFCNSLRTFVLVRGDGSEEAFCFLQCCDRIIPLPDKRRGQDGRGYVCRCQYFPTLALHHHEFDKHKFLTGSKPNIFLTGTRRSRIMEPPSEIVPLTELSPCSELLRPPMEPFSGTSRKLGTKVFRSDMMMWGYLDSHLRGFEVDKPIDDEYFHAILLDLLILGDPEWTEKVGCGLRWFEVRSDPTATVGRTFGLVRYDGSKADFSFERCIDNIFQVQAVRKSKKRGRGRRFRLRPHFLCLMGCSDSSSDNFK